MNAIFSRTSVRSFENRLVEKGKIEKLLQAAMAAPSAMNQQPWEFYVVNDMNKLEALAKVSPYAGPIGKATVAIVPCIAKDRLQLIEYGEIDLSIASENILLEAQHQELGAVWIGIAPHKERMEQVADVLHMPERLSPFAVIPVGYPLEKKQQENRYDASRVHYAE